MRLIDTNQKIIPTCPCRTKDSKNDVKKQSVIPRVPGGTKHNNHEENKS
jgi:ferredoxin-thioredoxin reductase catalytic subunit